MNRLAVKLFVVLGGPASLLCFTAIQGCGGAATKGQPTAGTSGAADDDLPRVQTATVKLQALERKIELPGTIEGYETADVYAKVGGYVNNVTVDIGDRVKKGQVLASLSVPEMEKEIEQRQAAIDSAKANAEQALAGINQAQAETARAEAALEEAKTELVQHEAQLAFSHAQHVRTSQLVGTGSLNQQLLDEVTYTRDAAKAAQSAAKARIRTAEADVTAAQANVEKARTDHKSMLAKVTLARAVYERAETMLDYATIRAPFDGLVTRRMVDPGAFVRSAAGNSAASPMVTVTRTDIVCVFLALPMAEVRWLDQGDRVVLDRINVLPDERFDGQVARFAAALDPISRMMRVEVDLENPDERLLPGYYGYVTLFLDEFGQTPVVPSSALMGDGDEKFVFVVKDGRCRKRPVTTNYQDGVIVGILSGLSGGEEVVQAGGGQLTDGQQVVGVSVGS